MSRVHLGIATRLPLRDLRLSKRNLIYRTGRGRYLFKDKWLAADRTLWAEHRRRCLLNYDLSMSYFRSLPQEEFDAALEGVLARFPQMAPVDDLCALDGVHGAYLTVFDRHRQLYVGKAEGKHGMKHRILRHWRNAAPFDRLLSGEPEESILPIDAFRMLDTTRIFACADEDPGALEEALVEAIPVRFSLNRTKGGTLAGGLHEAIANRRTRSLI